MIISHITNIHNLKKHGRLAQHTTEKHRHIFMKCIFWCIRKNVLWRDMNYLKFQYRGVP